MEAYNISWPELSAPEWLIQVSPTRRNEDKFDIEAKVPTGTTKETYRLIVKQALAQRFTLRVDREMRNEPVYFLDVSKNAPKVKEPPGTALEESSHPGPQGPNGFRMQPAGFSGILVSAGTGGIRIRFMRQTISELVRYQLEQLDKPVLNPTGLTGAYDSQTEGTGEYGILVVDHVERTPTAN